MNFQQFEEEDNYYEDDYDQEFNNDFNQYSNSKKPTQQINANGNVKANINISQAQKQSTIETNKSKQQVQQNWAQNDNRNSLPVIETKKSVAQLDTKPKIANGYTKIEPIEQHNYNSSSITTKNQNNSNNKFNLNDDYQIPTLSNNNQTNRTLARNNNSVLEQSMGKNQLKVNEQDYNSYQPSIGSKPQLKSKSIVKNSINAEFEVKESPQKQPPIKLQNSTNNNNTTSKNQQNPKPTEQIQDAKQNSQLGSVYKSNNFESTLKTSLSQNKQQPQNTNNGGGSVLLKKSMKATSSTPNLHSSLNPNQSSKKYQQSIIDAKQYLSTLQNASPNFIKKNIDQYLSKGTHDNPSDFQNILDFIERTRRKINEFQSNSRKQDEPDQDGIYLEDGVKYAAYYDENMFLSMTIKELKQQIDELFTKYDPRGVPVKSHPISDSLKYQSIDEQMKTREQEIINADKQLKAICQEYEKVYDRVEQVRNPTYLGDLHENVNSLEDDIKTLEKENKYKMIQQQKRESNIEKIMHDGAPKIIYRIKELQDKLASVKEGIKRETTRKQRFQELMSNLTDQEYQLKDQEEKCLIIAKKQNIKFKDIEELTPTLKHQQEQNKKLKEEKEQMSKQIMQQRLEGTLNQKKADMQEQANKKRLKELKQRYMELKNAMAEAQGQVQTKKVEIDELQEKMIQKVKSKSNGQQDFLDTDDQNYNKANKNQKQYNQPKGINYDAVQRAIEEMNQKETLAALVVQSTFRMLIQRRKYRQYQEQQKQIKLKQQQQKQQQQQQKMMQQQQQRQQQKQGATYGGLETQNGSNTQSQPQLKIQSQLNQQQQQQSHSQGVGVGLGNDQPMISQQQPNTNKLASKPNLMGKRRQ